MLVILTDFGAHCRYCLYTWILRFLYRSMLFAMASCSAARHHPSRSPGSAGAPHGFGPFFFALPASLGPPLALRKEQRYFKSILGIPCGWIPFQESHSNLSGLPRHQQCLRDETDDVSLHMGILQYYPYTIPNKDPHNPHVIPIYPLGSL